MHSFTFIRRWRSRVRTALFIFVMPATLLQSADHIRNVQVHAIQLERSSIIHWGHEPSNYKQWSTHSNRLIPVYTFGTRRAGAGIELTNYTGADSAYRNQQKVRELYGRIPKQTVAATADYLDQTDLATLQRAALVAGRKHVFLVIFDGMDWQTTQAAAIVSSGSLKYESGRGTGLHFQDYTAAGTTEFGFLVTSPHNSGTESDVNLQSVLNPGGIIPGGYVPDKGGLTPWSPGSDPEYLISRPIDAPLRHAYADSASSATSMTTGAKTYNGAINVNYAGSRLTTIAHEAQARGYSIGVVSNVPISHATPAAAYAHNVSRLDYQDLTRDLLGLPSISHPIKPLAGIEVLLGGGFGVEATENKAQGENFIPGNIYLASNDLTAVDVINDGRYVVAVRRRGVPGGPELRHAAQQAVCGNCRLLGFYGLGKYEGHLPYATADGDYQPAPGRFGKAEEYSLADICENPTLAELTCAALDVLSTNPKGFWLMVEAGDVDWANHDNNIDTSIGAVLSGDRAVRVITEWVESNSNWHESLLIVTADHGHYLVIDNPHGLIANESKEPESR